MNYSLNELLSLQGDIDHSLPTDSGAKVSPLIDYVMNWFNDYFQGGRFEEVNDVLELPDVVDKLCFDPLLSMCMMGVHAWDREPEKMLNFIPFVRKVRVKGLAIKALLEEDANFMDSWFGRLIRQPKYSKFDATEIMESTNV